MGPDFMKHGVVYPRYRLSVTHNVTHSRRFNLINS